MAAGLVNPVHDVDCGTRRQPAGMLEVRLLWHGSQEHDAWTLGYYVRLAGRWRGTGISGISTGSGSPRVAQHEVDGIVWCWQTQ